VGLIDEKTRDKKSRDSVHLINKTTAHLAGFYSPDADLFILIT
jgi:hypothetical protein